MFTLRPFDIEADTDALVAAVNAMGGSPTTSARIREEHRDQRESGKPFFRQTAVTADGMPVGFSSVGDVPWQSAEKMGCQVLVPAERRRRGIGSALFDTALNWVKEQSNVTTLLCNIQDNDPISLVFAENRGFTMSHHRFVSVLDVNTFDESPFSTVIDRVEASGIRLTSLAELGDTAEARQKLYDLNTLAACDEPTFDGTIIGYEEFARMVFDAWWFRADGQLLAFDGERAVGIAALGHNREQNRMFHAFTGTDPAYRGRQIALALKLLGIRFAKREGVTTIRTNNDSLNPAMLSINHKLGYVRQPGQYQMTRPL